MSLPPFLLENSSSYACLFECFQRCLRISKLNGTNRLFPPFPVTDSSILSKSTSANLRDSASLIRRPVSNSSSVRRCVRVFRLSGLNRNSFCKSVPLNVGGIFYSHFNFGIGFSPAQRKKAFSDRMRMLHPAGVVLASRIAATNLMGSGPCSSHFFQASL